MKKNLIKVVFLKHGAKLILLMKFFHIVFIYTESIEKINKKGKHISPMNFSRCLIYQAKYPDSERCKIPLTFVRKSLSVVTEHYIYTSFDQQFNQQKVFLFLRNERYLKQLWGEKEKKIGNWRKKYQWTENNQVTFL